MTRLILSTFALLATVACGMTLPPIVIGVPPPTKPTARPAEPSKPMATLALEVLDDGTGAPIGTAFARVEGGPERQADGVGYIAFQLPAGGTVYGVRVEADDYAPVTRRFQLGASADEADGAGNRQFTVRLASTKPAPTPAPVVVPPPPAPPPTAVPAPPAPPVESPTIAACAAANNDGRVSQECLDAVANQSPEDLRFCRQGAAISCHLIVRRVVKALRAGAQQTTESWGWGLLTKGGGEQGCNATECDGGLGPDGKYAEDVITFLQPGASVREWTGADVVGGIGAPGARFVGGALGPANDRPSNKWAPVP
ncbi:MAG: hypothetical protein Q8T13_04835 [Acidobacteriota bacterium]|nr:hypothetical protein [Acidobacteriota bacterium]